MKKDYFNGATALNCAQQALFEAHQGLIEEEVRVFLSKYRQACRSDNYQHEAMVGLWIASSRFEASSGSDFVCFARSCIKQQLKEVHYLLSQPLDIPEKKRGEVVLCRLDERSESSGSGLMEASEEDIDDELSYIPSFAEEQDSADAAERLEQLLSKLTPRERKLVELHNGIGCSKLQMKDAAARLGIGLRQAERTYQRALSKMELSASERDEE